MHISLIAANADDDVNSPWSIYISYRFQFLYFTYCGHICKIRSTTSIED